MNATKIKSVLNNNAVVVSLPDSSEAIIMEKGIGFQLHAGDKLEASGRHKLFTLKKDEYSRHFRELVLEIPYDVFEVCDEICTHANEKLDTLGPSLFIALADHVNSGIERQKNGIVLHNMTLWDTKLLYPQEYECAEWGCSLIKKRLGYDFGKDEAGVIAMHIINSEYQKQRNVADTLIEVQAILKIIRYGMMIDFDIESLAYYRFMIHLKFLIERIRGNIKLKDTMDNSLYTELTESYPREFRCSKRIAEYFEEKYDYSMSRDETAFLLLHINKIADASKA